MVQHSKSAVSKQTISTQAQPLIHTTLTEFCNFITEQNILMQNQRVEPMSGLPKKEQRKERKRKLKDIKMVLTNTKPCLFYKSNIIQEALRIGQKQWSVTPDLYNGQNPSIVRAILNKRNIRVKDYLSNIYDKLPRFDEIPSKYDSDDEARNRDSKWNKIANMILSRVKFDQENLFRHISDAHLYQYQLKSSDQLVKMCITRQKKNLEQDRVPRFPLTCTKVLGKHLYLMEKQSDKEQAVKIEKLKQYRIKNRNEMADMKRNIEILVDKFVLRKIEDGAIRNSIEAENQKKQINEIVLNKLQESHKHVNNLGRRYSQLVPFN